MGLNGGCVSWPRMGGKKTSRRQKKTSEPSTGGDGVTFSRQKWICLRNFFTWQFCDRDLFEMVSFKGFLVTSNVWGWKGRGLNHLVSIFRLVFWELFNTSWWQLIASCFIQYHMNEVMIFVFKICHTYDIITSIFWFHKDTIHSFIPKLRCSFVLVFSSW